MIDVTELLVSLRGAGRQYAAGPTVINALAGIDLDLASGEFVGLTGSPGSGKSTLVRVLGLLDRPTFGTYLFSGHDTTGLSERELAALRNQHIALVLGGSTLVSALSALDNVSLPLRYRGMSVREASAHAEEALECLQVSHRMTHLPAQLSPLDAQLVAVARALASGAELILCDEPLARLGRQARPAFVNAVDYLHSAGRTIVCTGDAPELLALADRTMHLADGRLADAIANDHAEGEFHASDRSCE